MSRRRMERPSSGSGDGDKPLLEAVLDHFAVDYVPTKATQMIHCPLHEDVTSSCSINTTKQLWNCHSCGQGGDSWELLMKREETDFDGARALAAAEQLATGDAGGGRGDVREGRYGRRKPVSARKGSDRGNGGYVPSWRRQ